MTEKFIKIPINRFELNKKVLFDFFIHLPLNNKMIRLIAAGTEIDPESLNGFRAKKIEFLYIPNSGNLSKDPNKIPIQENSNISLATPLSEVAAVENLANEVSVKKIEPITDLANPNSLEPVSEASLSSSVNIEISNTDGAPVEAQANQLVSSEPSPDDSEQRFSSSPPTEEAELRFSPDEKLEEATTILSGSKPEKMEEIRISSTPRAKEEIRKISGGKIETEDDSEFHFMPDPVKEKTEEVFRFENKLDALKEEVINKNEQLPEDKKGDLIRNMKVTLIISRISREIIKEITIGLGQSIDRRVDLNAKMKVLKELLFKAESSTNLDEDIPKEFSVSEEHQDLENAITKAENVNAIISLLTPRIEQTTQVKNNALKYCADLEHSLRSMREIPNTASKLATQLGYNLGYINIDFLSELALSAMLYFQADKGFSNSESEKLSLFKNIIDEGESEFNSVVTDSKEIIALLDAYFNEPSCDRGNTDFEQTTFDSAVESLFQKRRPVNLWNITKWKQGIERGPSIEVHSLCAKACSLALKHSREIA